MFDRDRFVGVTGASRILNLSVARVRQLALEGRIPAIETPIGRLFDRTELERLAAERRAQQEHRKAAA